MQPVLAQDFPPPLVAAELVSSAVSSFAQELNVDTLPEAPPRRWSSPRLGIGAGLAAFGIWYAFSEMRCRWRGSLSGAAPHPAADGTRSVHAPTDASSALADLQIAYGNARSPVTAWGGSACSLDWQYSSEEWWSATVGDRQLGPTSYARVDPDAVRSWATSDPDSRRQGDHQPADAATLERMRGTVEAEAYRPPEKFYPGLAAAAVGGVLVLVFGRVDVPVSVDVTPDSAALSVNLGF